LGHYLCLDLDLAEVIDQHRCRRGCGHGVDHRFRQRKARVGCAGAALLVARARLPEQDSVR
jgi:hypothetical protein